MLRSIVGCKSLCVTSAGMVVGPRCRARLLSGIGSFCTGLVIDTFSSVSSELDVLLGVLHADVILVLC